MKDTTTLLRSQCDALRDLPPETFKAAVLGLWDFEMDGKEPSDPVVKMAVGLVRPLIDKRNERSKAGKSGAEKRWQNIANDSKPMANDAEAMANDSKPMPKIEILNIKDKKIKDNKKHIVENQFSTVLNYLNEKAGTSFRLQSKDSRKHIKARFDEGFTVEDFKTVIDKKVSEWKGTDMEKYLRPSTLFGTKFEGYLNQKTGAAGGFANFAHSGRDWDDLAYQIMEEQ